MTQVSLRSLAPLALTLLFSTPAVSAAAEDPRTGPAPEWVRPHAAPLEVTRPNGELFGGFHYLLHDQQYHVPRQEYYTHHAYRVVTRDGLAEMSDISAEFDPSHQELTFHFLRLHRGGRVIDQLADHPIRTFQREEGMDSHLYDGSLTAVIHQENVRIGDVIEYAYTIRGWNPAFGGRLFTIEPQAYIVPLERIRLRVLSPSDTPVHFNPRHDAKGPDTRPIGELTEYSWRLDGVPAVVLEDNLPPWFDPLAEVEVSAFSEWAEVVDWALPFYVISAGDRTELTRLAAEIAPAAEAEQRIVQCIRFVQDEIRYLGMEDGLGAFVPRPPAEVHRRRYGDCKDKSLLLAGLLQQMGVAARPMLVDPFRGRDLPDRLPSPFAFNHCIVAFDHGGRRHFVDPTQNLQGGDLDNMIAPRYHHGLEIGPGVEGLTPIPDPVPGSTEILYHFEIGEIGGPVPLTVRTTYRESAADLRRSIYDSYSTEEIERNNLDYYSQAFPAIRPGERFRIEDEQRDSRNVVITHESYVVDDFWTFVDEDSTIRQVEIYPLELTEYLDLTPSAARTMPYYLGPRVKVKAVVQVDMPEDWPLESLDLEILGDTYEYRSTLDNRARRIEATYEYERTATFVAADEAVGTIADHDKMLEDLTFVVTDVVPGEASVPAQTLVVVFLVALVALAILGIMLHRRYDPDPPGAGDGPSGLGGWLVLPGIGIIFGPIREVVAIFQEKDLFDVGLLETAAILDPASGLGGLLMINAIALVIGAAGIVMSVLLIVQFFARRSSFPRLFTITLVAGLVLTILGFGMIMTGGEYEGYGADRFEAFRDLFSSIVAALVWIPYFRLSRRVKATFVRRRDGTEPRPSEAGAEDPSLPLAAGTGAENGTVPAAAVRPPARWPGTMVWAAVFQALGFLAVLVLAVTMAGDEPATDPAERVGAWIGSIVIFAMFATPPAVGFFAVIRRRTWARTYSLTTFGLVVGGLLLGALWMGLFSGDPEGPQAALGLVVFAVPVILLVCFLIFSAGARSFPPEVGGWAGDLSGAGAGPEADDLCRRLIGDRFRAIRDRETGLTMELHEDESGGNVSLVAGAQPGLVRTLVLEMKGGRQLNLHVGAAHFGWRPCGELRVRESFFETVAGLLSGSLRLVEFHDGDEVRVVYIQEMRKQGWANRLQWTGSGRGGVRGLQEQVVMLRA